ncbi:uncharacterized protein N0V89_009267 [Didymosphaeria variabile]|uniref:Uncharacterized protein n=1 Tax=Didymosphaeria variabile TaxID=1932322 RepID=A0A9W9C7G6_9PLEO|nr:uncharacterized protein N0V89_009267 [Didymosphaeria variabile]KAJ4347895.1 hypothetical protein N0V89_009267 [Didymosphaeria variabile]
MSLQHRNLAQVWEHLQGRHDIANLLREIVGQHSIASHDTESRSIEESIRTIGWIKIVFDAQRCYLSGIATGVAECPPYVLSCLLPPDLLFSTILYLINVKTSLFSSQTTLMTREFTRPRHILAQTILSGLRLLLLRKEGINANDKRRLQNAINQAWREDRLHGVERFIVAELFAEILNALNEPSRENPYAREWANAKLPTYAAGLYPLDIRVETFVTPLIHGTMEEDWMDAYWVLHDCLWAVECAVTQRFVDLRRQTGVLGSNQISVDTDEILEQLWHTRTSLIISIFHVTGPMQPTPALLESLAVTLLDWDEDLENFLSRQDSLLQQQRAPTRSGPNRAYGRHIAELNPYFEAAMTSFADWLPNRQSGYEQFSVRRPGVTRHNMQEMVRDWVTKMAAPNTETISKEQESARLPVYVVDCPKLHVISKRLLEHKLRWTDKWAFEAIQGNSPIVNWKEGVACPSCTGSEKIKLARLIEPFQLLTTALDTSTWRDDFSLSQYSVGESGSYDAASGSRSTTSDAGSIVPSLTSNSGVSNSQPSHASRPSDPDIQIVPPLQPPRYTESPVSPTTYNPLSPRSHSLESALEYPISPLNESLNIPIALPIASRLSIDLPIPVRTPSIDENIAEAESASMPSEMSSGMNVFTPTSSVRSTPSFSKMKSSSRTIRIGSSFRRKYSTKEKESTPLPKEPCFAFSAAGHSLLLWEVGADHLVRFDVPSNDASAIQGCRYEVAGIEAAAAGNHKCAIVASTGLSPRRLVIFNSINIKSEAEIDLDLPGRAGELCLAVSRNDKFAAVSLNDQILIFGLENGGIKKLSFHHQINVYEMRSGAIKKRTIPVGRTTSDDTVSTLHDFEKEPGWFGGQGRGLSTREKAEEQQRQSVIISRKIYFSTDSRCLVVATQLGDHCIYADVWDCTTEPVTTVAEHSRSFKMPPWTLNDGDLTSVFYDSARRSALVTAFLGKEYPLLIPFPGHDNLQNETYSTKVVQAAQSPTGETFTVVNAMTEIIQFEYTTKGTLSPRKLKKASSKISQGVFKPGAIALAMPLENVLQIFWVKDGKCMLRSVKIGASEQFKDYDLRPHYDRLMSLKTKPVIARAPSLMIPELDAT